VFILDKTQIQIGANEAWLWVAVEEPLHSRILDINISRHRNMLIAESFLRSLVKLYGKHVIFSDGGIYGILMHMYHFRIKT
jgi:putative transposase